MTPAVSQSANALSGVLLFFVVYPERNAPGKPRVTVEFFRNGKAVGVSRPPVGSPDELNSYPMLQFARLPAGDYVARLIVQEGGRVSSESTSVTMVP